MDRGKKIWLIFHHRGSSKVYVHEVGKHGCAWHTMFEHRCMRFSTLSEATKFCIKHELKIHQAEPVSLCTTAKTS